MTDARALSRGDVVCRVIEGRLYQHRTIAQQKAAPPNRLFRMIDAQYWYYVADAPEDRALREAWERYREGFLYAGAHLEPDRECPPGISDRYLVARGPGVVACEECDSGQGPSGKEDDDGCRFCNPDDLDHPTLVPLAELPEVRLGSISHLQPCPLLHRDVALGCPIEQALCPDLAGLIVMRQEECGGCLENDALEGYPEPHCPRCHGTGKVEAVDVYWRSPKCPDPRCHNGYYTEAPHNDLAADACDTCGGRWTDASD